MQNFTNKKIPSISSIQEILRARNIKISGKQWIGSIEVMGVLEDYLGEYRSPLVYNLSNHGISKQYCVGSVFFSFPGAELCCS